MNNVEQYLAKQLKERAVAGNLRQLTAKRAPVDFFSNDYLGLVTTGALAKLMHPYIFEMTGTGATGSRLLSGNTIEAEELECRIALFHGAESALIFNSGYDANIGLLSSVADRHTTILSDELCHASLKDGIRLSQCSRKYKFAHNDLHELSDLLRKHDGGAPVLVVVESVYSMDGDTAPLAEIASLCGSYGAQLIVDEAHGTGIFGARGEGLVQKLALQDKVFARIHTFGKALGCHGAAVVGGALLKQYLINFARTFIYTTALPPHSIRAISCAYSYLSAPDFTNEPLHELISYFRQRIAASGDERWRDSHSPVQALVTGGNEKTREVAGRLQRAGLQVNAILQPTVSPGGERLRVCLHSFNTREEVDLLFAHCI